MDNARIFLELFKNANWNDLKKHLITKEGQEEDERKYREGESKVARIARISLDAMNTINPDVKFTVETHRMIVYLTHTTKSPCVPHC